MDTYETRKVTYEKVQVSATVRDCNLRTSQGTLCQTEIYDASSQEFADFHKIGVNADYSPIRCVTNYFQR